MTGRQPCAEATRVLTTPVASLCLVAGPGGLWRLEWDCTGDNQPGSGPAEAHLDRAEAALRAYFADPAADLSGIERASGVGTAFQHRVWRALRTIPPGQVRTYGELARSLASGPRAVGNAARANPWPVVVPCHRLVASQGLGGYGGATQGRGLAIKRWLLAHEGYLAEGG
jgi:methylated-DNA-[protein]-cysteine S-methyltransferase